MLTCQLVVICFQIKFLQSLISFSVSDACICILHNLAGESLCQRGVMRYQDTKCYAAIPAQESGCSSC